VRERLGLPRPTTSREWIAFLEAIADDIAAFEADRGPLSQIVPPRFSHLATGRLYDMALGPRGAPHLPDWSLARPTGVVRPAVRTG
jgi:hypothetical protein